MTSKKQIEANKKNALKSTGPKTSFGKLVASKNATKHGLRARQIVIDGESQDDYDKLRQMLIEHYAPENPIEAALVDRISVCLWRLRRTETIEAQIFDNLRQEIEEAKSSSKPDPLLIKMPVSVQPQKNARLEICRLLKTILQEYLKSTPNRQVEEMLEKVESSIQHYKEHPDVFYVPAERALLEFVREEFAETEDLSDQKVEEIDKAIAFLRKLEREAENENKPNHGHAVEADMTNNNVLNKFTRYESQIQGSLYKAMHELEKQQRSSKL